MMMFVREIWRAGRIAVLALIGWLAAYGAAMAQQPAKPQTESVGYGIYVLAYFIVIFAIALGMLFVCRPSNRRERAKPEEFVGSKMVKDDEEE
jgi:heme/copper-type cytochrome/quinol oxidase subunit 2